MIGQFEVYVYSPTNPSSRVPIGNLVEGILWSTIAPGGYGHLTMRFAVKDALLIPPELRIFAQVAVMDGPFPVFLGRLDEPGIVSDTNGDYYDITAQGGATALKDEPRDFAYTTKTAQYIIGDQISVRSAYIAIDQDTSLILPNAPSATFSPAYNGKTIEDILNELITQLGDYTWEVWGHSTNVDVGYFPTWQLQVHIRDTATLAYGAWPEDIVSLNVRPTVDYSYNAVTLLYRDSATSVPTSVTVQDSRLNSNKSQGSAPFPYRLLRKDLGTLLLSSTQAATIANALLAQYQNTNYKIEVNLARLRDDAGMEVPLWQCRADKNIFIPQLAAVSTILPFTFTQNSGLYYITETEYTESGGTPNLKMTLNTFTDEAAFQIAQLQYQANLATTNKKVEAVLQAVGSPETGTCGCSAPSNAPASSVWEQGVNFKTTMTNVPSSITLTAVSSTNVTSVTAANVTRTGFQFRMTINAAAAASWSGNYTTNGN